MNNKINMRNSPLENLSLLENLQGEKRADELDIYIPFIASILDELNSDVVDKELLQEKIRDKFNIITPMSAIDSILIRAKTRRLLTKENKKYFINKNELDTLLANLNKNKKEITKSVNIVVDSYLDFCEKEFKNRPERDSAENEIYNFIRNNISIFSDSIQSDKLSENGKEKANKYRVASFIKFINKDKKSLIDDITKLVKGILLANYLTIVDKTSTKRKFNNITIYLDTPIIIGILGWDGPTRQKSLSEFISLLNELDIRIKIFERTFSELNAIFDDWKSYLNTGRYDKFYEMTRQLLKSRGTTSEQLNTEQALLESKLNISKIYIDRDFKLKREFCCDEKKLDRYLEKTGFKKRVAREHDVCCISNVFNSRSNMEIKTLDNTFSIFITTNTKLEYITQRFFRKEIPLSSIPVVSSENWLTTILWLKHPDKFNNFPFDILLTDAYGTLNSDDLFWSKFIKRLEELKTSGGISEENFLLVRYNNLLFNMVNLRSAIKEHDLDDDDIYMVIDNIKKQHIQEKDKEVSEREIEIKRLKDSSSKTKSRIEKISEKLSKLVYWILILISVIPFLLYLYYFDSNLKSVIEHNDKLSQLNFKVVWWLGAQIVGCLGYIALAKIFANKITPKIRNKLIVFFTGEANSKS